MKRLTLSTALFRVGLAAVLIPLAVESARGAGMLMADGGLGGKLQIKEQDVRVTINNGIAVTRIDQTFVNTENRVVEALYTFPVPEHASVSNFSMIINGKEMVGEVVEKERARQIYESYKATRRDPGLLEQVNYKRFELRVFPIAAGAEQQVSITYYQQLNFEHDSARYVFPLATTTNGIEDRTTGTFSVTVDVKSEIPIKSLVSPSHRDDFVVTSHGANYSRASLEVTGGDLNRDVVVVFDVERPRTGIDLVFSKQNAEDGFFLLTLTGGKELEETASGMDYMFVADISGSMANDGKLTLSREAIAHFIDALGPEDRFNVMAFNTAPQVQFQAMSTADDNRRQAARTFLMDQRAKGGTALRPAVMAAFQYKDADRPLNIVIMSDGMTEVTQQRELIDSIQSAPVGTRVFCVGIGNDVNRPLLKQIAEGTGGLAAFVSHQDDFAREANSFRRKLMRPVASNVTIEIEGVGAYDVMPKSLPDLFHGAPLRIWGRYGRGGPAAITVRADIQGQVWSDRIEVEFAKQADDNPEIERMWAFTRVNELLDQIRHEGESADKVSEVVRLCESYSIVSEYASFIVLENDAEYQRWAIERRNANRVHRDRTAHERLRKQLDRLREESLAQLGPRSDQRTNVSFVGPAREPTAVDNSLDVVAADTPSIESAPVIQGPRDLDMGPRFESPQRSGGGNSGGAIDPITGTIAAGLAGAYAWNARRRHRLTKS